MSSTTSHISWRPSFFSSSSRRSPTSTANPSSSKMSSSTTMPSFFQWMVQQRSIGEQSSCPSAEATKSTSSKHRHHSRSYKQEKRRQVVMQFLQEEGLHESIKHVWDNTHCHTPHTHRHHTTHEHGKCSPLLEDESLSSGYTEATCISSTCGDADDTASFTGSHTSDSDFYDLPTTTTPGEHEQKDCSQGGVRWHPSVEDQLQTRRIWLLNNPPKIDPNRIKTRTRQRLELVVVVVHTQVEPEGEYFDPYCGYSDDDDNSSESSDDNDEGEVVIEEEGGHRYFEI